MLNLFETYLNAQGLPPEAEELDLQAVLAAYNNITGIKLLRNRGGQPSGVAFVVSAPEYCDDSCCSQRYSSLLPAMFVSTIASQQC